MEYEIRQGIVYWALKGQYTITKWLGLDTKVHYPVTEYNRHSIYMGIISGR